MNITRIIKSSRVLVLKPNIGGEESVTTLNKTRTEERSCVTCSIQQHLTEILVEL